MNPCMENIAEKMRNDYEKVPGIEFAINTASMGPDAAKDVTFNIRGNDYEQMQTIARTVPPAITNRSFPERKYANWN